MYFLSALAPLPEQHDGFDTWASIVIPAIADLLTLLVAVVSLVIAAAALRTARNANDLAKDRIVKDDRAARVAVVPLFAQWFRHELFVGEVDPQSSNFSESIKRESNLSHRLLLLGEPSGPALNSWLSLAVALYRLRPEFPAAEALLEGYHLIEQWAESPGLVKDLNETARAVRGLRPEKMRLPPESEGGETGDASGDVIANPTEDPPAR